MTRAERDALIARLATSLVTSGLIDEDGERGRNALPSTADQPQPQQKEQSDVSE